MGLTWNSHLFQSILQRAKMTLQQNVLFYITLQSTEKNKSLTEPYTKTFYIRSQPLQTQRSENQNFLTFVSLQWASVGRFLWVFYWFLLLHFCFLFLQVWYFLYAFLLGPKIGPRPYLVYTRGHLYFIPNVVEAPKG